MCPGAVHVGSAHFSVLIHFSSSQFCVVICKCTQTSHCPNDDPKPYMIVCVNFLSLSLYISTVCFCLFLYQLPRYQCQLVSRPFIHRSTHTHTHTPTHPLGVYIYIYITSCNVYIPLCIVGGYLCCVYILYSHA